MPDASQCAASRGPYSTKAPNSPQPVGPSISATSRTVMPRNRTRIGSATTCSRSSRSGRAGITGGRPRGPPERSHAPRDRRSVRAAQCGDRPKAPPDPRICRPRVSRSHRRRTAARRRRWSARGWPGRPSSRSSGASTRPLGAVRVTATLMLRSGSSGVTGGSLCSEMRMPVATAEPAGIQRDPRSWPNRPSTMTSPQ